MSHNHDTASAISALNRSYTPIFDELDAHFLTTPVATKPRNIIIEAQVTTTEDHVDDHVDTRAGNLEVAFWILALGSTVGTVLWLWITLATPVIA